MPSSFSRRATAAGLRRAVSATSHVHVIGADEVQRAAIDPGHDELALVQRAVDVVRREAGYACPQGELRGAQVLRLQRQVMSHRLRRAVSVARRQAAGAAERSARRRGGRHAAVRARSTSARTRQPARWSLTRPHACISA